MIGIDVQISCASEKPFSKERLFLDLYSLAPLNSLQMKILNLSFRLEYFYLSLVLFLICTTPTSAQVNHNTFDFYFSKATQDSLSLDTRKQLLKMAYRQVARMKNDSVTYWNYSK